MSRSFEETAMERTEAEWPRKGLPDMLQIAVSQISKLPSLEADTSHWPSLEKARELTAPE